MDLKPTVFEQKNFDLKIDHMFWFDTTFESIITELIH